MNRPSKQKQSGNRPDKLLGSLEARRNKALRTIAEYRGEFAQRQRNSTGQIIDGKPLKLVKSS
jgi:hypothetical protein